ncbi:MAG: ribosome silencing factor [Actinomycetota bacterium]|nr:ribosome silencing factor [Acidimicrobiia bacterium]MDQ3385557.1 ribosome silencing factor [Actinomycetota bacterium]
MDPSALGGAVEGEDARWPVEAARAAEAKSATDVVVLEVGALLALTGHFVIATGSNARLVRSVADEVERRVHDAGGPRPVRVEGRDEATWVLMDYGDFVVHIFSTEARDYYDLERLWGDVPIIAWRDPAVAASESRGGAR